MGLMDPDVCAPGEDVNSTVMGGGYSGDTWSGTSMATPHNSGLIALMLSKNNALTLATIDGILEITALDCGPTRKDNEYGAGRIQALEAINAVPAPPIITLDLRPDSMVVGRGDTLGFRVIFKNNTSEVQNFYGIAEVILPDGTPFPGNPVRGPRFLDLQPSEEEEYHLIHVIPQTAPLGLYTYVGTIGTSPENIIHQDRFYFELTE